MRGAGSAPNASQVQWQAGECHQGDAIGKEQGANWEQTGSCKCRIFCICSICAPSSRDQQQGAIADDVGKDKEFARLDIARLNICLARFIVQRSPSPPFHPLPHHNLNSLNPARRLQHLCACPYTCPAPCMQQTYRLVVVQYSATPRALTLPRELCYKHATRDGL